MSILTLLFLFFSLIYISLNLRNQSLCKKLDGIEELLNKINIKILIFLFNIIKHLLDIIKHNLKNLPIFLSHFNFCLKDGITRSSLLSRSHKKWHYSDHHFCQGSKEVI